MSDQPIHVQADVREYIAAQLRQAVLAKYVELGWWCPRCNLEAPPSEYPDPMIDWEDYSQLPGWCRFCGMDPKVEGPYSWDRFQPKGLLDIGKPSDTTGEKNPTHLIGEYHYYRGEPEWPA